MKLSTRAEYGIRALLELALQYREDPKKPLMLQTIAERQELSKKYLEQLFIPLRKARLVEGVRGPFGGYRLARPPEEIYLDEVISILEGSIAVANCVQLPELCKHSGQCATQEIWFQLSKAIESTLGNISLAHIMERHNCLVQNLEALGQFSSFDTSSCLEGGNGE